jgi:FimV-like protein
MRRRSAEQEDFSDELAVIATNVDQQIPKPAPTPSSLLERVSSPSFKPTRGPLEKTSSLSVGPASSIDPAEKADLAQTDLEATEPATADDTLPALLDEERTAKTGQTEKVLASLDFHLADLAKVSAKAEDKATDIATQPSWQLSDEEPIIVAEGSPVEAGELSTGISNKALDKELEWQLPDLKPSVPKPPVEETVEDNLEEQLKGLSFELDDVTTPVWSPRKKVEASPSAAKHIAVETKAEKQGYFEDKPQGLDFEFEITGKPGVDLKPDEDTLTAEDHVETKLDLAVAYLDMGDKEGAHSLLQEVLNEGSSEQKQRARACMARLG